MQYLLNLKREFSRRKDDEPVFPLKRRLNHGDSERKRFSRAGLRESEQIFSLYRGRNGFFLDRRWNFKIKFVKNGKNIRRDSKAVKIRFISHYTHTLS